MSTPWKIATSMKAMRRRRAGRRSCARNDSNATLGFPRAREVGALLPLVRAIDRGLPLRQLAEERERLLAIEQCEVRHGLGVLRSQAHGLLEEADAVAGELGAQ